MSNTQVASPSAEAVRTLLVSPRIADDPANPKRNVFSSGVEIPLGLLYLSSYLRAKGYETKVLDLRLSRDPLGELRAGLEAYKPGVVGITAFTCEIQGAAQVARFVKAADDTILTVVGGIHASALPRETLQQYPVFDMLVYGEGEMTLTDVIQATQMKGDFSAVQGLSLRTSDGIQMTPPRPLIENLDELPFPNRSEVDTSKYVPGAATFNCLRTPTTGIMAGRGCPYNCYHCSKGVWGCTVRYRSATNIFQEMLECVQQYGIRDFRFFDDILTLPNGPIRDLCGMLIDSNLDISFNCYGRIDHVDEDLLRLMKRAGCYHIKYGIEFGSNHALKLANRRTTLDQARQAVLVTKKSGILVKGNFMMGIPGETLEDCEATIAFAKELFPDLVSFGLFNLFPGSKFHRDLSETATARNLHARLSTHVVVGLISRAYREFYLRPSYVLHFMSRIIIDRRRLVMGLKAGLVGCFSLFSFLVRRLLGRA